METERWLRVRSRCIHQFSATCFIIRTSNKDDARNKRSIIVEHDGERQKRCYRSDASSDKCYCSSPVRSSFSFPRQRAEPSLEVEEPQLATVIDFRWKRAPMPSRIRESRSHRLALASALALAQPHTHIHMKLYYTQRWTRAYVWKCSVFTFSWTLYTFYLLIYSLNDLLLIFVPNTCYEKWRNRCVCCVFFTRCLSVGIVFVQHIQTWSTAHTVNARIYTCKRSERIRESNCLFVVVFFLVVGGKYFEAFFANKPTLQHTMFIITTHFNEHKAYKWNDNYYYIRKVCAMGS